MAPVEADLVRGLLTVPVAKRICSLNALHRHPFFRGFNWDALKAKRLPSPVAPLIVSPAMASGHQQRSEGVKAVESNLIAFLDTGAQSELAEAASRNDVPRLRELIGAGGVAETCDYDRRTPMHIAAAEGCLEAAQYLLADAHAFHSPEDRWGATPLDDALRGKTARHAAIADLLRASGAVKIRLSGSSENPQASLCEAAANGDIVELRLLLSSGLEVNAGDYDRRTALHLAASEGLLETIHFLIEEAGADHSPIDRWGGTPLDDAMRQGHHSAAVCLKSKGGKLGATAPSREHNLAADLCAAAHSSDMARLRMLVKDSHADVNLGDYDRRCALHLAASEGDMPVVSMLLHELHANPLVVDRWGNTPLDDAERCGHEHVAALLRKAGGQTGAGYIGNAQPTGTGPTTFLTPSVGIPVASHRTAQSSTTCVLM